MNLPHETPPDTLFAGKHLKLVARGHWEYAIRTVATEAVGIVAVTPDRRVIFVEQMRPPVGRRVIEIPAGLVGDLAEAADEPRLIAAQRELWEETGYESDQWTLLSAGYSSPGLTDEQVTIYLAENIRKSGVGGGDESESIVVHEVPLVDCDAWLAEQQSAGLGVDLKLYSGLYLLNQRLSARR